VNDFKGSLDFEAQRSQAEVRQAQRQRGSSTMAGHRADVDLVPHQSRPRYKESSRLRSLIQTYRNESLLVFDYEAPQQPNLKNVARNEDKHSAAMLVKDLMRASYASHKKESMENAIMTAKTIKRAKDLKLVMKELDVRQAANGDRALEAVADFNKDMRVLALGACQIQDQINSVLEENDLLIQWMEHLEKGTIQTEDRILQLSNNSPQDQGYQ